MTPLFKEKIVIELLATEINNNFTQQQKEKLHFLIGTSDIVDYAGIKLLAKNIKNYLVDELYTIKHGQVLNILAKSYGFSNHHSMTASFEDKVRHYEGTTDVFKIFQVKDELFQLFKDKNITWRVRDDNNDNYFIFYELDDSKRTSESVDERLDYYKTKKSNEYQAKMAVNKLLRKYNIKPYENKVPLMKLSSKKGIDVNKFRDMIVQKYRDFFNPIWIKGGDRQPGDVQPIVDIKWCFLTYENVFLESGLLHVGSYSSDSAHNETKSFLTFLIRYGEVDDFIFIERLLKQEEILPTINRNSLSKNLLLRKYEKFKFTEDFMEQYEMFHTRSLNSILQSMKIVVNLTQKDMQLLNLYADDVKDVIPYYNFMNNLSTILIRCCIENINKHDRYSEIEKVLYLYFLHYDSEKKIKEVKSINKSKDIVLVSRLTQLVEVVCSRIEELVEKNKLELK